MWSLDFSVEKLPVGCVIVFYVTFCCLKGKITGSSYLFFIFLIYLVIYQVFYLFLEIFRRQVFLINLNMFRFQFSEMIWLKLLYPTLSLGFLFTFLQFIVSHYRFYCGGFVKNYCFILLGVFYRLYLNFLDQLIFQL